MTTLPAGDQGLLERGVVVQSLRTQLLHGRDGLADVPVTLERVLREEAWRDRIDTNTRERFAFDYFPDFVAADPPAGLGATLHLVERIVRDTPAEELFNRARKRAKRGKGSGNNGPKSRPGDSRAHDLGRLRLERPELAERVDSGDLTVHAAKIKAGWRRPYVSVPADTASHAVEALARRFSTTEIRLALDELEAT